MAEETVGSEYGFESDDIKVSPFNFGLNAGKTFLTKFEWTNTGGKDGAEQEALDIVFNINGTDKNYRMFPVTKAFLKDNKGETTDRNAPEFIEEVKNFNSRVFHIVHCFVATDVYQAAISRKIESFKDFCGIVASLLPKDYDKKPLDIFLQFQWRPSANQTRTFLEIPKKQKYGKWVVPAQPGTWNKVAVENPEDGNREALTYTNEKAEKHPFVRNGWYMNHEFAHQQSEGGTATTNDSATAPEATAQNATPAGKTEAW